MGEGSKRVASVAWADAGAVAVVAAAAVGRSVAEAPVERYQICRS